MKNNICLKSVAYAVGSRQLDVPTMLQALGRDDLVEKIGFSSLRKLDLEKGESELDLVQTSFDRLVENVGPILDNIELLICISQNQPHGGLPHFSALVHNKLGLRQDCFVFDVGLGCSGFVEGWNILESVMELNGLSTGLLVTCDCYSRVIDENDVNTAPLFGDGAASALFMRGGPGFRSKSWSRGISSSKAGGLIVQQSSLAMNGREVLNMAIGPALRSLKYLLGSQGLDKQTNLDSLVLHQGSKYVVDTLAERAGLLDISVGLPSRSFGNLVSSSVPACLADCWSSLGKSSVLGGFGVGLSWSFMHMEYVND